MTDELSRNEHLKEASRYLRGTIAEGLRDEITGAIVEDDQQLVKFHGMYLQDDRDLRPERTRKKMERAFGFMIRVRDHRRLPQLDAMALRSTKSPATTAMAACGLPRARRCNCTASSNRISRIRSRLIDAVLLNSIAARGDINRNVMRRQSR